MSTTTTTQLVKIYSTVRQRRLWVQAQLNNQPPDYTVNLSDILYPPVDVNVNQFYQDTPSKDVKDAELYAAYKVAMAPITNYKTSVTKLSNAYFFAQISGTCLKNVMLRVVYTNSFLGVMETSQSALERMWYSINYMIVYSSNYEILKSQRIEDYIRTLTLGNDKFSTRKGNIKSWYILSKACAELINPTPNFAGVARLYVEHCRIISADGTVPEELARGRRSNEYHAYFMMPLIIVTYMLMKIGSSVYDQPNVHKLVNYILSVYFNQSSLQDPMSNISPWFTLYYAIFGYRYLNPAYVESVRKLVQNVKTNDTTNIGSFVYTFVAANEKFIIPKF